MPELVSHWHHHFQGLSHSTDKFYNELQAAIDRKKIPEVKFERVEHKEGGMFSGKRQYLRVKRGALWFDICGAPFGGAGFFVSSRLVSEETFSEAVAGNNMLLRAMLGTNTFYKQDSALMYQELVHAALLEVIDGLTSAASLPALPESARKPKMQAFYA